MTVAAADARTTVSPSVAALRAEFGPAVERLSRLPLGALITTDTVPPPRDLPLQLDVVTVAPVLADAVRRLSGAPPPA